MTEMISLGRITKTFGLLGGVVLKFFNEASTTILPDMSVYVGCFKDTAQKMTVEKILPGSRIFFCGLTDIDEAKNLIGAEVFVERKNFPILNDEEYYLTDILGASGFDSSNTLLGVVSGFFHNGAQLLIEIKRPDNKIFSVPMVKSLVKEIILSDKDKRVIFDLPEGLIDLAI